MKVRFRLALAGVLLAGTGGAVALAKSIAGPQETRIAIARPQRPPSTPRVREKGDLCNGGLDRLANVEIIPDAVIRSGGREHVEYHSEITLQRGLKVGVAWRADIVDDRGLAVVPKMGNGTFKGRAGHVGFTNALKAPLADGFYSLRVRAAVSADDEAPDVIQAVQHIEVKNGHWAELSDHEWFERSRANEVFTEAELAARGLR